MNTLKAEKRDLQTKAKRLRREGYVTGNVYGKDLEGAIPLKYNALEAEAFLKENPEGSKAVLELDGKKMSVVVKEVQFNFLRRQYQELDFQTIPGETPAKKTVRKKPAKKAEEPEKAEKIEEAEKTEE